MTMQKLTRDDLFSLEKYAEVRGEFRAQVMAHKKHRQVALGIGIHNLGEGLAIGSAYSLGELTLGAMLVAGFALHNATEGVAIVSPILREQGNQIPRLIGPPVILYFLARRDPADRTRATLAIYITVVVLTRRHTVPVRTGRR